MHRPIFSLTVHYNASEFQYKGFGVVSPDPLLRTCWYEQFTISLTFYFLHRQMKMVMVFIITITQSPFKVIGFFLWCYNRYYVCLLLPL